MLRLDKVSRIFEQGGERAGIFEAELELEPACLAVLAGPSGSGKTTLLQLAGLLDEPDEGSVFLEGRKATGLAEAERCELRRRKLGFVFQQFNLLATLNALENVALPLELQGLTRSQAELRALDMLQKVGLEDRRSHLPAQLSGGQQQRVAIARALVTRPILVLADEPTANLDHAHGDPLLELMDHLCKETGTAFLVASHDPSVINRAHRVYRILDGHIMDEELRKHRE